MTGKNAKMNHLNTEIGSRLKEIREDFNLSQSQFSQLLNISISRCVNLERGLLPLTPLEIKTIQKEFQTSIDWLISGEGEKSIPKRLKEIIMNIYKENNGEDEDMEYLLMIFPDFMKGLKLSLKEFLERNRPALNEETIEFLNRFTGQKKNEEHIKAARG